MSSRRAASAGGTNDPPYVHTPSSSDVLFGRGSGPNDHEGNVLFRTLVKARKSEYMATNHRQTKANIAKEIVTAIRAQSGRFLKKADARECRNLGLEEDADVWCCVDEKIVMEKAKQALRQKGGFQDAAVGGSGTSDASPPRQDNDAAAVEEANRVLSEDSINIAPLSYHVPAETLAHFGATAHEQQPHSMVPPQAAHPEIYRSGDMSLHMNNPEVHHQHHHHHHQQHWRAATYNGNPETMPEGGGAAAASYVPHSIHATVQGYLAEDLPPRQAYAQTMHNHQQQHDMADPLPHGHNHERLSEENIRRSVAAAAAGYQDEEAPVGDGPEDDERRRSLQVEDLMNSFHRMGTDEMGTSSSDNLRSHESNETMGTIEPLPMGASNVSMMSSSTFSIFKGALCDGVSSPRGSLTRPGKYKRETSSSSNSQGTSSEGKARRESGSSDMSLSFSHMDTAWGQNSGGSRPGNQFSLVIEGDEVDMSNQELQGGASSQKIAAEPRPLHLMEEDPDSIRFGSTSMSILKATLGDSGDAMGNSSGKTSQNESNGDAN